VAGTRRALSVNTTFSAACVLQYALLFNYFYKLDEILIIVICRGAEQRGTISVQHHHWRACDLRSRRYGRGRPDTVDAVLLWNCFR
jgi:hypothetical protein